jgi:hypothetical protein
MPEIVVTPTSHLPRIVLGLLRSGWEISAVPRSERLARNAQMIIMRYASHEVRLRILAYKVTESSRGQPHERRIEITTTYQSGLAILSGFDDVVLGLEVTQDVFVGVDPRRLKMGGATHNASTFLGIEGITAAHSGGLVIIPRSVSASEFPNHTEYHAFFKEDGLSEYLTNIKTIHAGLYSTGGTFPNGTGLQRKLQKIAIPASAQRGDSLELAFAKVPGPQRGPENSEVLACEQGTLSLKKKRKITPQQLKLIQQACEESGQLGEQFVLLKERERLLRHGQAKAAARVRRVSLDSVNEGYDIESFENDGKTSRYVEVKATVGTGMSFQMSEGEWAAAKFYGEQYVIARVCRVRAKPEVVYLMDPVKLEQGGKLVKTATGWLVSPT